MPGEAHRRGRLAGWLAVGLAGLAAAELATAVAVAVAVGVSFAVAVASFTVTNGAMGLAFGVCGLLLAWHRPRNPIGWLFLGAGVAEATSAAAAMLLGFGAYSGWHLGALRLFGTLFIFPWTVAIGICLPLALLLFPDGRPVGPRWRWLTWAAVGVGLLFVLSAAGAGPLMVGHRLVTPYLTVPFYRRLSILEGLVSPAWAVIMASAVASLAVRYRRGGDRERRQLLWLVLAGLAALAYGGLVWGVLGAGPVLGLLVFPLIPAAVTVAILRYQLLDIKLVVSRALVYAALTAAAAAAYVGLVALLDALVSSRVSVGAAVAASVVVAIGFNLARARVQALIDRALYGYRRDPVRAVSRVGDRLAGTGAAGLPGVLESLCDSLRLPFAAVRYGSADVAVHGQPPDRLHTVVLRYGGGHIGELVVGLRPGQRQLSAPDIAVLDLLATPLAIAVHATALSAALQRSRASLVAAREEERRRLRRDLHDGLGAALTGIAFTADAASNTLAAAPDEAARLLGSVAADAREAIAGIRRLVYDLRPPALDELGLIGSLRQQCDHLALRADGRRAAVLIDAPAGLAALPAAVEVAAYRIVTEAITNAVRHAGASKIDVCLAPAGSGGLRIQVRDDGPASRGWRPGVGLASMRERAAELGGCCEAGPGPAGGGVVTVVLPAGEGGPG